MIKTRIFGIGLPLLVLATAGHAGTFTFATAAGATESAGNAVNASATVVTDAAAGTVTITLFNNLVNPTTVAQNISDFDFTLTGVTGGTLTSSGQQITVNADGTFATGSTGTTGWALSSASGSYILNVLGTATAPSMTILGKPGSGGTYSNANSSIAGNGPHNPFLNQTATFTISGLTGLTANTTVTNAVFSFGTDAGNNVPGGGSSTVPEPVSLSLVGGGLLAFGLLRKRLPR